MIGKAVIKPKIIHEFCVYEGTKESYDELYKWSQIENPQDFLFDDSKIPPEIIIYCEGEKQIAKKGAVIVGSNGHFHLCKDNEFEEIFIIYK